MLNLLWASAAVAVAAFLYALNSVYWALTPSVPVEGETNVPGPPDGWTLPIVGDAWRFYGASNLKEIWDELSSLVTPRDLLIRLKMGRHLIIAVTDPIISEVLLNSSKTTSKPLDVYNEFNKFGDGPISRNGERWKALKIPLEKLTQHKYILANYLDTFSEGAVELCTLLDAEHGNGVIDVHHFVKRIHVKMICDTVMGVPTSRMKDAECFVDFLSEDALNSLKIAFKMIMKVQNKIPLIYYFSDERKRTIEVIKQASRRTQLLDTRKEILNENGQNLKDPDFAPECYVDVILQQAEKEKLHPEHANRMGMEMVIGGFDTPSIAVSSTILFLAMHPEHQEKVYKEQIDIMGSCLEPPTQTEVAGMEYLSMVYQESLRHVGVPGIARLVEAQLVIEGNTFPKGSIAYVSFHANRTNPKYWARPDEFYPEHFLPEEVAKRPKGAYLPFSAGSRVCPGKNYAHISSRIILSTVIRKFKFTTHLKFSEMTYNYQLMLDSAKGYPVEVTRRAARAS